MMRKLKEAQPFFNSTGMTLLEVVIVLILISILFFVGVRTMSDSADRARFRETVSEMETYRIAIVGDERRVELGRRVDFGYWGDTAAWPSAMTDIASRVIANDTDAINEDSWGNNYVLASTATEWSVTSLGADGAAGGTGFGQDIELSFLRADYEENTVVIYVHDARGTLLCPTESGVLPEGHILRVDLDDSSGNNFYWYPIVPVGGGGLDFDRGLFHTSSATVFAGECMVSVSIADGTGLMFPLTGNTYNWCPELTGGVAPQTIENTFIVYPIGSSGKPNVFYVKTSGIAYNGVNEV